MNELQETGQSEIAKIFNEYRAKLDEINKKWYERYPKPVDKEPDNPIDYNYRKLAEIIAKKHQESQNLLEEAEPQVDEQTAEMIHRLEFKVQQAKAILDECKSELHIKYSDLDKAIADAQEKLKYDSLKLQKLVFLN
jgi:hypothetical protein